MTDTFDLLIPACGTGATHLRDQGRGGILCGDYTRRYTQAGIVPAGSATYGDCNQQARDLNAARRP